MQHMHDKNGVQNNDDKKGELRKVKTVGLTKKTKHCHQKHCSHPFPGSSVWEKTGSIHTSTNSTHYYSSGPQRHVHAYTGMKPHSQSPKDWTDSGLSFTDPHPSQVVRLGTESALRTPRTITIFIRQHHRYSKGKDKQPHLPTHPLS